MPLETRFTASFPTLKGCSLIITCICVNTDDSLLMKIEREKLLINSTYTLIIMSHVTVIDEDKHISIS